MFSLTAITIGGALRDTGQAGAGIGLLVVFVGAIVDPLLERRIAAAIR